MSLFDRKLHMPLTMFLPAMCFTVPFSFYHYDTASVMHAVQAVNTVALLFHVFSVLVFGATREDSRLRRDFTRSAMLIVFFSFSLTMLRVVTDREISSSSCD